MELECPVLRAHRLNHRPTSKVLIWWSFNSSINPDQGVGTTHLYPWESGEPTPPSASSVNDNPCQKSNTLGGGSLRGLKELRAVGETKFQCEEALLTRKGFVLDTFYIWQWHDLTVGPATSFFHDRGFKIVVAGETININLMCLIFINNVCCFVFKGI